MKALIITGIVIGVLYIYSLSNSVILTALFIGMLCLSIAYIFGMLDYHPPTPEKMKEPNTDGSFIALGYINGELVVVSGKEGYGQSTIRIACKPSFHQSIHDFRIRKAFIYICDKIRVLPLATECIFLSSIKDKKTWRNYAQLIFMDQPLYTGYKSENGKYIKESTMQIG